MKIFNKYIFIAMAVLIIAIVLLFMNNLNLRKENRRVSDNYETTLLKIDREQQLTKDELKKMYKKYDTLSNKLDIKLKNIERIVKIKYEFRDSTVIKAKTIVDTVHEKLNFIATNKCYEISGFVQKNDVLINNVHVDDKLDLFIYKEKPKWMLGLRKFWKRYTHTAKVYSECKGDTMYIEQNIKIIKK